MTDPLDVVSGEISDESVLLCLDEFMVCLITCGVLILCTFI